MAAFLPCSPHPNCTCTQIFHFKQHWLFILQKVTLGEAQMFILFALKIFSRDYRLVQLLLRHVYNV